MLQVLTIYSHLISGYIRYRKFCGLTVPSNWEEKPKEIRQENWDNLKLVYNKVEDIDAFTGGVSEESISDGIVGRVFIEFQNKFCRPKVFKRRN